MYGHNYIFAKKFHEILLMHFPSGRQVFPTKARSVGKKLDHQVRVPSSLAINALNGQSINGKFITTETYGTDCRISAKTDFTNI
jgi:hypothetical protein